MDALRGSALSWAERGSEDVMVIPELPVFAPESATREDEPRDPVQGLTAAEAKATLPYRDYRAWWAAWVALKPYKKTWKRRAVMPVPATFDGIDPELG